jgi:transcriptional regulator with XRE-family HTH domain
MLDKNALRAEIVRNGYTQKEVAEKSGRDQSYIARVERGKADIQLTSFFRLASILGIRFVPTYI